MIVGCGRGEGRPGVQAAAVRNTIQANKAMAASTIREPTIVKASEPPSQHQRDADRKHDGADDMQAGLDFRASRPAPAAGTIR